MLDHNVMRGASVFILRSLSMQTRRCTEEKQDPRQRTPSATSPLASINNSLPKNNGERVSKTTPVGNMKDNPESLFLKLVQVVCSMDELL